ncbi:zinc ribbon domain-containing protein [Arthrobacter gandavensis]|uniref:FmdB family zinc ribbon protein n=1 Tax=Arthrobacter gandavensis TaxID=169960 RepID=UPI00189020EF|nr:zinc ribbon domain-containing protein [Arthrobacter gandavensis]MBF4994228.1 zinc ribbon domain-containing protein [Arthrobacter gandavensis]
MPLYAYRCADCADFEVQARMGSARDTEPCPVCGSAAARKFTAPNLSRASSSAYKLIESTARSASDPAVVSSPGGRNSPNERNQAGPRITRNPLHRKLPRPD